MTATLGSGALISEAAHETPGEHCCSPTSVPDADLDANELSWTQRRVHGAIIWYQRLREGRPSPCRFYPTCSSYALEAFDTHGTWRGGWLTLRRLARCRPLGPSGFDPVPPASGADEASDVNVDTDRGRPNSPISLVQKGG